MEEMDSLTLNIKENRIVEFEVRLWLFAFISN